MSQEEELTEQEIQQLIDKCFLPNVERVNPFVGLSVDALGLLSEAVTRTLESGVHIGYNIEDVERLSKLSDEEKMEQIGSGGLRRTMDGPGLETDEIHMLYLLDAYIIRAMEESETQEHSASLIYELEEMLKDN